MHRLWGAVSAAVMTLSLAFVAQAGAQISLGNSGAPIAPTVGPEPPLAATPKASCGPGSRPETGLQGRVSPDDHASGRAAKGFTCNTELVGEYRKANAIGTVGGFKVERYVDAAGHDCAYYDTTLMFPTNLLDQEGGTNVMDMSDPTHPKLTERLLTPAMDTPHESLVVSHKRGVLAAVAGNLSTNVGFVDVYDISKDCRHPELKSSTPVGFLGHESGMAPDGKTFYSASPAAQTLVAVDISNLSAPVPLWFGNYDSHGLSISADGNRAYVAGVNSGLIILDTSEIQKRVPNPTVREVARLQWKSMSIPQNAIPITEHGHPYLVEIDEYGQGQAVGAGRIIDIGDETKPKVVSNLRLQVHQPENFATIAGDNGQQNPVQGYAGHYCNVPTRVDPTIVACSMIVSGLRVFDIRDIEHPREIAYFNAPIDQRVVPGVGIIPKPSNWAMSSPSFVPERHEIWYSDGLSGFYAVRVTNGADAGSFGAGPGLFGPASSPAAGPGAAKRSCLARRSALRSRGVGAVRLRSSRSRLQRLSVKPVQVTSRSFRYCVEGSPGRVSAVFARRGRVVLVASSAGVTTKKLRKAYPRSKSLGGGVYRTSRRSSRVVLVRGGRVRVVAVADRSLLRSATNLRRQLTLAGL